jgi:tetrapyrrole methylase family protein/MazG family protein
MPLLVVPLAPEETPDLTLDEWDRLSGCERVLFERPDHPLVERLRAAGVVAGAFDDDPPADKDGWALVADPGSPRVLELAREGAIVSAGNASVPDSLTAAHGAYLGRRAASELGTLAYVMARLRSPDGCPWDREQTHESLRVHLIEEAHEVLEAIDEGSLGPELEEELGDLLLQVAFHSQLAADDKRFDLAGVARGITAKLLHRHPHVFGETQVEDAAEVVRNWEAIKAEEKQRSDPFEGIPASLSALLQAYKTQKRAAARGFSPDQDEARAKLADSLATPADPNGLGDALFWLVAVARSAGVDPGGALRSPTARFRSNL